MPLHFKSKGAYRRYTAYVKMHHLSKHHPRVAYIAGKKHRIKHRRKR